MMSNIPSETKISIVFTGLAGNPSESDGNRSF